MEQCILSALSVKTLIFIGTKYNARVQFVFTKVFIFIHADDTDDPLVEGQCYQLVLIKAVDPEQLVYYLKERLDRNTQTNNYLLIHGFKRSYESFIMSETMP